MQLLDNQTADGSSPWVAAISDGLINVYVTGNLGSGTLTLEALAPDGTTAVPITDGSFTTAGVKVIQAASLALRATLSDATSPDVSVWVEGANVELRSTIRGRV